MGVMIYLLEVDYLDPVTKLVGTLRFSSGGYTTYPSDTPPNTWYEPRIKSPNNWSAAVFTDGQTGGGAEGGFGTAQLHNQDGFFDQYIPAAFDGQRLRLLYGNREQPYSTFSVVLTGTMAQPEFTWSYCNFKIRDYSKFFDKALSQYNYLGNNVEGKGVEGTPSDLMGKSKPLCFGRCLNFTPTCVSTYYMLFQVHAGPEGRGGRIKAIDAVYVDAVAWELDTSLGTAGDFPTLEAMVAATPAAGKYVTCLAYGMFMMSGSVSSGITCDVRGCALGGVYVDTVPGIIRRIVESYIRRKRANLIEWSEDFSNAVWSVSGLTKGAQITSGQYAGMTPLAETSETGQHVFSQVLSLGTGMLCYSLPVFPAGRTMARLMLRNPAAPGNNCLADFDLTTGEVVLLQVNGHAVGPQYTATDFITDGGVIVDASGALRLWVSGQPDETFSQVEACLFFLSGTASSYTDSYAGSGLVAGYVGAPNLGAQIEAYSSPSRYTGPTTTAPVSGYDPEVGPEVHTASFDALATLGGSATAEVGYALSTGDTTTAADVLSAIAATAGCWWVFDRDGLMRIGQLAKSSPDATPVATFAVGDPVEPCRILSLDRANFYSAGDGAPIYKIVMQCVRNWTTQQKSSVATSLWTADPTRVAWVSKQWREIAAEDLTTLAAHALASSVTLAGYFAKFADALVEAKRRLNFYTHPVSRFTIRISVSEMLCQVNIGDTVKLQAPRFALNSGVNGTVVRITETHENGEATLEVAA